MTIKQIALIAISILITVKGYAQTDSTASPLTFSGYVEVYYNYDFNKTPNHTRPSFVYSYNRSNEVNLNLGYIKAAYQERNVRANLALATGTYMNANYAAEPGVLKNIYEANVGVKISKKHDVWIDAGVFASHIGFESAVGKDDWTLTRNIVSDNTPYYESGAKISYTSNNSKWFISGLVLNGWQRIQRVDGNNTLAFGHQLTFKPNSKVTLNSSSFVGNDKPDSIKQIRYYHNFYGIFQITNKFAFIAGFDIGAQQKSKGSSSYNQWYAPVLIMKLSPNAKNNVAARIEYYDDAKGVIINTGTPNGFNTWGYSLDYDYLIRDNVMWRVEARCFSSKDEIFAKDNNTTNTNNNFFITTSLAISF